MVGYEAANAIVRVRQVFLRLERMITLILTSSEIRATLCLCGGLIRRLTSALSASL
jgi:hypothetical protein